MPGKPTPNQTTQLNATSSSSTLGLDSLSPSFLTIVSFSQDARYWLPRALSAWDTPLTRSRMRSRSSAASRRLKRDSNLSGCQRMSSTRSRLRCSSLPAASCRATLQPPVPLLLACGGRKINSGSVFNEAGLTVPQLRGACASASAVLSTNSQAHEHVSCQGAVARAPPAAQPMAFPYLDVLSVPYKRRL